MTGPPPDLPAALAARLAGYTAEAQTIGRSAARVFRLTAEARSPLFLKSEPAGPFNRIAAEAERLRWLAGAGLPAPEVVACEPGGDTVFLLTTAVPGTDLATITDLAPPAIADMVAEALHRLHDLQPAACPFDRRLEIAIAEAGRHLAAGRVDESDFDAERSGRSAQDLFRELLSRRPATEDAVVCHGDACLPNLLARDGRFSGFVDCSRLGLADRHADLALAARSLVFNLGAGWDDRLFAAYGLTPDPERLAYYRLLDEFF